MKKFVLFLLFGTLLPISAFAGIDNSLLTPKTAEENRIQKMFGDTYFTSTYNIDNLDSDISALENESGIYENSIQAISKEPTWNKQVFLDFVAALRLSDKKKATQIYSKNWSSISPFLPTCCAFKNYLSFQTTKDGILALVDSGNGATSYSLEFIYIKENTIYSINTQSIAFLENQKESIVKKYFANIRSSKRFYRIYTAFGKDVIKLMK